jgi:hypothetical protein
MLADPECRLGVRWRGMGASLDIPRVELYYEDGPKRWIEQLARPLCKASPPGETAATFLEQTWPGLPRSAGPSGLSETG